MAGRRSTRSPQVATRLILDSGAVIGLAAGRPRIRALIEQAVESGADVVVPVVVVTETTRGGPRDAGVNRVLKIVDAVTDIDEAIGRRAGVLLGHTRSNATADALIVATADALGGGRIATSDPKDLRPFAEQATGVSILTV